MIQSKQDIIPLLILKVGDKYISEYIYQLYRNYYYGKSRNWYIYQSQRLSLNIRMNQINQKRNLLLAIEIISHPDFISRSNQKLFVDLTFENHMKYYFQYLKYYQCESLLNQTKQKINIFEKIKIVNKIINLFQQLKKQYNHFNEDISDTLLKYNIYEILNTQYLSYCDLSYLWEPGIIVDHQNQIYSFRHFNVPNLNISYATIPPILDVLHNTS
tara:strand:+ start:1344 stop:1988 length:645 start_codon:yes stop_codon:yes gene_type:complete